VRMCNPYERRLSGKMAVEPPNGWITKEPVPFSLDEGESQNCRVTIAVPQNAEPKDYPIRVRFDFDWAKLAIPPS